ncbi:MAG: RNA polymerase sigma-70 factor [Tannerella sp.]|jgi:RNA polymerase sigma-70 factor (ECF subfamily)|nr:RNA polymerase sigma-70 factor [Tannerella sp.]
MAINNFNEIYTKYYKSSFLFAKSYVHDDMVAEDITSESLISLWQTMKKETVINPPNLLLVILKNNVLNYLKHQAVHQKVMESFSAKMVRDLNYRIATLDACDPEEIFSTEISEIVEKTLETLPEQTCRIFEMSRHENLSVKEIAEQLSISSKSVEYHITKSLKALRIALKDYLFFYFLLLGL